MLNKFGIKKSFLELELPFCDDVFIYYNENAILSGYWYDYVSNYVCELEEFGEIYLSYCLEDTSWSIEYIHTLEDYEKMSSEEIQKCKEAIDFHWAALNNSCGRELTSDYLSEQGIVPLEFDGSYIDGILILRNEKIRKAMHIWKTEEKYQKSKEYIEFQKVSDIILLDRYFPYMSNVDMKDTDWVCISYVIGEIYDGVVEDVGLHQLNYEAVIFLILADMIAVDFLDHYEEIAKESII